MKKTVAGKKFRVGLRTIERALMDERKIKQALDIKQQKPNSMSLKGAQHRQLHLFLPL